MIDILRDDYLLLLLSLPILLNTHYILTLWLTTVPEHTVNFVRLVLIFSLSESISQPLITVQNATGRIRNYQIVVGGLQMLNLPVSYLLLRYGYAPESVLIVAILISQCCLMARLYMLRFSIGLSARKFIKDVYLNDLCVSIIAGIFPILTLSMADKSFIMFLAHCALTVICTLLSVLFIGCNKKERDMIIKKGVQFYHKVF